MKISILLFLLLPCFAGAQERDLLTVQQSGSKLCYNDTTASVQSLDLRLRLPLWTNKKHTLMTTVGYKQLQLNHFPDLFTKNLYGITAQSVWLYKKSAKRAWQ